MHNESSTAKDVVNSEVLMAAVSCTSAACFLSCRAICGTLVGFGVYVAVTRIVSDLSSQIVTLIFLSIRL